MWQLTCTVSRRGWQCGQCTFVNEDLTAEVCEMCEALREHAES